MTGFDDFLRTLLFRKFCVGKVKFDFMEALLAVCITGVGFALRTAFPDSGMPDMRMLMAEWYLAVCAGVLVKRMTGRVRRGLYAYGIMVTFRPSLWWDDHGKQCQYRRTYMYLCIVLSGKWNHVDVHDPGRCTVAVECQIYRPCSCGNGFVEIQRTSF